MSPVSAKPIRPPPRPPGVSDHCTSAPLTFPPCYKRPALPCTLESDPLCIFLKNNNPREVEVTLFPLVFYMRFRVYHQPTELGISRLLQTGTRVCCALGGGGGHSFGSYNLHP